MRVADLQCFIPNSLLRREIVGRPFYDKLEWTIITTTLFLAIISLTTIYSASLSGTRRSDIVFRQASWFILGFILIAVVTSIDYHIISALAYPIYGIVVVSLGGVLVFGERVAGAQRWIKVGSFSLQPSELAKIALILVLAKYFSDKKKDTVYFTDLILSGIFLAIPVALILKEPDLGMSILLFPIFVAIVFVAGISARHIIILSVCGLAAIPFAWLNLKGYQKDRLIAFINPDSDPLGSGYHVIQSKIAIGSGGFWGKGYMHGTQSQLNFLPEQFTDFIFSVFSEEWGFVGSFVLLFIFLILMLKGLSIAAKARDKLGRLIAVGVVTILAIHMFVNIGVATGIMPVTGLTLPLISYGGSSIFSTSIALGLLLNVSYRRFEF